MFLAKSYCDIGNSQSSSSIVAPDGEITTTFEYDGIQRSREGDGHRGQRDASFYLRPARQRAHQADGEHGGERQDDCLYLRLPPSDGYQLSRPSRK